MGEPGSKAYTPLGMIFNYSMAVISPGLVVWFLSEYWLDMKWVVLGGIYFYSAGTLLYRYHNRMMD